MKRKKNTKYTHGNKSKHSEMGQCDKTQSRELRTAHLSVIMTVQDFN